MDSFTGFLHSLSCVTFSQLQFFVTLTPPKVSLIPLYKATHNTASYKIRKARRHHMKTAQCVDVITCLARAVISSSPMVFSCIPTSFIVAEDIISLTLAPFAAIAVRLGVRTRNTKPVTGITRTATDIVIWKKKSNCDWLSVKGKLSHRVTGWTDQATWFILTRKPNQGII